jgi:alpha-mannosidase
VSGGDYGLSILNDGKYSLDVCGNDLRLTAVRSAIFADHFCERDELCEFMDQGVQEFRYVIVPHKGARNAEIPKKAAELNAPPVHIIETYHKGALPQKFEGIRVGAENIIATVFKRAEDGDGFILRAYETAGEATAAEFDLPVLNRKWTASFKIGEVKTFFLADDEGKAVEERNFVE